MTAIITAHGLKFTVEATEFDAQERADGAQMIADRLADLPAAVVAALHAHADRYDGRLYADEVKKLLDAGAVEGIEADCLLAIAGEAITRLMDDGGWSDSANVQHGVSAPGLMISAA